MKSGRNIFQALNVVGKINPRRVLKVQPVAMNGVKVSARTFLFISKKSFVFFICGFNVFEWGQRQGILSDWGRISRVEPPCSN
jgi:hypothetical protein